MARSRDDAASRGPVHLTGFASRIVQLRIVLPAASTTLILPSRGLTLLPSLVSPSPDAVISHSKSASVSVTPRLNTRLGHFIRPSSLCVYPFCPPSASSSTSSCTASPEI